MPLKKGLIYNVSLLLLLGGSACLGVYLYRNVSVKALGFSPEEDYVSYLQLLLKENYKPVNEDTDNETLQNILIERIFPHYKQPFNYSKNQIFPESPTFTITGEDKSNNSSKNIYIIKKNTDNKPEELKQACINALKGDSKSDDKSNIYRLKEWCTEPTIEDVLKRHKFKINKSDSDWKTILNSDWFKNENTKHQSFFSEDETNKLKQQNNESEKIKK